MTADSSWRRILLDRRQIERHLKSLIASAKTVSKIEPAVFVLDGGKNIVWSSDASGAMFGYEPKELAGQNVEVLLRGQPPASRPDSGGEHPEVTPPGRRSRILGWRKDGASFEAEIELCPLPTADQPFDVAVVRDATVASRIEEEFGEHIEALRGCLEVMGRLTSGFISSAEEESRAWARELHDVHSHKISLLIMRLAPLMPSQVNDRILQWLVESLEEISDGLHGISRRMHPHILNLFGLPVALEAEVDEFASETGIRATFSHREIPESLPPDISLCIYRVAQECLRNARKHSLAKNVDVQLTGQHGALTLVIRDDGKGFDPEDTSRAGLGLISIEERLRAVGGDFNIYSKPGAGTEVTARVPLS